MYRIDDLKNMQVTTNLGNEDGWVSARPIPDGFIQRAKDAWEVLVGRADAVKWNGQ